MIGRLIYALVIWLVLPMVLVRLYWRGLREPVYLEDPGQRFGRYAHPANHASDRRIIWLHAVSLGEINAARPLVEKLIQRFPSHRILLTQMTATGREAARRLFGDRVLIAWLPYDYPFAVSRFLRHFKPELGILIETEIWFNLVGICKQEGVPLLLANARMSEKSCIAYRRAGRLASSAFNGLAAVAAQTDADARRLALLGARSPSVVGNLKFDVSVSRQDEVLGQALRDRFGSRKVLLLASTREGEEKLLLDALERHPLSDAVVAIVPRHPHRFEEVAGLLRSRGLQFVRRSDASGMPDVCGYFLGDSVGEMAAYYRAADVAFIGGSLLDLGGQNLIEACDAGVPVLIGPSTYNFSAATDAAIAAAAAIRVANADDMLEKAAQLLNDAHKRQSMGEAGKRFCAMHRGTADRIVEIAAGLLVGK